MKTSRERTDRKGAEKKSTDQKADQQRDERNFIEIEKKKRLSSKLHTTESTVVKGVGKRVR